MTKAGETLSIYCVKISERVVINILVRPGSDTKRFKEAFPDAMAFSYVWDATDPVAEVMRQRELLSTRQTRANQDHSPK